MVNDFRSLDKIATGEVSVTVAAELIRTTMQELTETKAQKVYSVLRAWVWKALNERRRDSELRKWHALISQTSAYLEDEYFPHAERIRVLHELVHESISVSIVYSFNDLAARSHVKEILSYLYVSPQRTLARQELQSKLGLKDPNMTRVLTMLSTSGLLERSARGKSAFYSLTRDGAERARSLPHVIIMSGGEDAVNSLSGRNHGLHHTTRSHLLKVSIATTTGHLSRPPNEHVKLSLQRREKMDNKKPQGIYSKPGDY